MSFLSGLMGGKVDSYVDQAVDKVAVVAKEKVKEMMGGDGKEKPKETEEGGASGGINALAGMFSSDDKKEKESGGGFTDLFSGGKDEKQSSSGGGEVSLTDALGDLVSGGDDKPKAKETNTTDQVLSFGKSLFS